MSSRDKRKQEERKANARRWALEEGARYSNPLISLDDLFATTTPQDAADHGHLSLRVSHNKQQSDLAGQAVHCMEMLRQAGVMMVRSVSSYVGSGADRAKMVDVLDQAQAKGCKYVFYECEDRAIRHPDYGGSKNFRLGPTAEQLEDLRDQLKQRWLIGVALIPPGTDPAEVRSRQSRRGQLIKGKGGRSLRKTDIAYRRRRKKYLLPLVRMLRDGGGSLGAIGKTLGISKRTVQCYLAG